MWHSISTEFEMLFREMETIISVFPSLKWWWHLISCTHRIVVESSFSVLLTHRDMWGDSGILSVWPRGISYNRIYNPNNIFTDKQIVQVCKQACPHLDRLSPLFFSPSYHTMENSGMDLVSAAYEIPISLNRPKHELPDFYSGFNLPWSKHRIHRLILNWGQLLSISLHSHSKGSQRL